MRQHRIERGVKGPAQKVIEVVVQGIGCRTLHGEAVDGHLLGGEAEQRCGTYGVCAHTCRLDLGIVQSGLL